MKLAVLAFTEKGALLAEGLALLMPKGYEINAERCPQNGLHSWVEGHFPNCDALIFIGAAGIAVRAIAPFADKKTSDPAVLVIDECAQYVIPLLSGHIGGANALAVSIAKLLSAKAVITTATDQSGVFAVDSWAVEQGYSIMNPERIKAVSARLLSGNVMRIKSDFPIDISPELAEQTEVTDCAPFDVDITIKTNSSAALRLAPPVLVLGVGCKKGTTAETLHEAFERLCSEYGIEPRAFCRVCSINIKAQEAGLIAFCHEIGLPFTTFSAQELGAVDGEFSASDFVRQVTGVENVCERSAVLGSTGTLLLPKQAKNGVTMAVGKATHRVSLSPPELG